MMFDLTSLTEYLRSNITLSDTERHSLLESSTTLINDIDRIAMEISKLQPTLYMTGLMRERRDKKHLLSFHHAVLAPVRRLPPEVLAIVFIHCLPADEYVKPDPDTAPMLVSHVCKYWRDLSLQTTRLWTSLSVAEKQGYIPEEEHGCEGIISTWFSRAGHLPLSLESIYPLSPDLHSRYSGRFKRLKISPYDNEAFRRYCDPYVWPKILSSYCNLEELDVCMKSDLRSRWLWLASPTKVEVNRLSIPLPNLRSWTIRSGTFDAVKYYLEVLTLPNLRRLEFLCGYRTMWVDIYPSVLSCVSRSDAPLEHLTISVSSRDMIARISEESQVELVESFPFLRMLEICGSKLYPRVTEVLAMRREGTIPSEQ